MISDDWIVLDDWAPVTHTGNIDSLGARCVCPRAPKQIQVYFTDSKLSRGILLWHSMHSVF